MRDVEKKKGVEVQIHPDDRVQAIMEQIRESEIIQAVDRLRLVHAEHKKRVFILTNIVCDITVDHLLSWRDLVKGGPSFLLAWQRSGGVLPLSYKHLSSRFPDLWTSPNSVNQSLKNKGVKFLDSVVMKY